MLAIFCLFTVYAEALETNHFARTNIYVELGGIAAPWSINADIRFKKQADGWGIRLGYGQSISTQLTYQNIAIACNRIWMLVPTKTHFFELGIGIANLFPGSDREKFDALIGRVSYFPLPDLHIGWRYQSPHAFSFRAGLHVPAILSYGIYFGGGWAF